MRFATTLSGLLISFAVTYGVLAQSASAAQAYPAKPIRIIVRAAPPTPTRGGRRSS